MVIRISALLLLCLSSWVWSQEDPLIGFMLENQYLYTYPLVSIDSSVDAAHSQWSYGDSDDRAELSLEDPDTTYNGSGFTELVRAQTLFSISDYPVRAAVKLFRVIDDSLDSYCSGMMVAPDVVLTDCHCLGTYYYEGVYYDSIVFFESIWAFPAFDNSSPHPVYGGSRAVEYITFQSNLEQSWRKDIALIRLKDPLGEQTGWVGIGFNNDDTFFEETLFHEFSYPGFMDSSLIPPARNADTLFYNYGHLNDFSWEFPGYSGTGIPGQSGTSLLYTDNEAYYSMATFVWSGTGHQRITPEIFYSFEAAINHDPSTLADEAEMILDYALSDAYPNPFNPETNINYMITNDEHVIVKVFDLKGREVLNLENGPQLAGSHQIRLNMSQFASGAYIYQIRAGHFSASKRMLLLK